MLDAEKIEQQRDLLTAHRETLALLLYQQAMHGLAHTPPAIIHSIKNARSEILKIKTLLQKSGIVDDHPDDEYSPPQQGQSVDSASNRLWSCLKCNANNPPNMKFCLNCGAKLLQTCPECEKEASLISTGICSNCGYAYELAKHRKELKHQRQQLQSEIDTIIQQDEDIRVAMSEEESFWLQVFVMFLSITFFLGGIFVLGISGLLVFSPNREASQLGSIVLNWYIPVVFVISFAIPLITRKINSAKRVRGRSKLVGLEPLQSCLRFIDTELADTNLP